MSALIMSKKNENSIFTRKVLHKNVKGYNLVQDFYNTGEKRTDPFLLKPKHKITDPFDYLHLPTKNKIVAYYKTGGIEYELSANKLYEAFYFITGIKAKETTFDKPKSHYRHEITYYPTGQIYIEDIYQKDIYLIKEWYINGQLRFIDNGSLVIVWNSQGQKIGESEVKFINYHEGSCTYWHNNGQKALEGYMKDNQPDGKWLGWHENGNKESKKHYQQGKAEGLFETWFINGNKKLEEHFKDGKKHGLSSSFHPMDTSLYYQIDYINDNGSGHWVEWYENGQKHIEGDFKNGTKDGLWTIWHPNGQIQTQGRLQENIKVGLWQCWFENGQLQYQYDYQYKDNEQPSFLDEDSSTQYKPWNTLEYLINHGTIGNYTGTYTEYYDNGQIHLVRQYDDQGYNTGLWQNWYKSGQKYSEGYFDEQWPVGTWIFWSEQGEKIAEGFYQDAFLQYGILPSDYRVTS